MQCKDGRNVKIIRQRSGAGNLARINAGFWAGVMTAGFGAIPAAVAVSQLATCSKVGFEFWYENEPLRNQPLKNDAFLGVLFVHSGLEKLEEVVNAKSPPSDKEALEACKQLGDAYLWHQLATIGSNGTVLERQALLARTCLGHTSLCGVGELDDDVQYDPTLQVDRLGPFAERMKCATMQENSEEPSPDNDSDDSESDSDLQPVDQDLLPEPTAEEVRYQEDLASADAASSGPTKVRDDSSWIKAPSESSSMAPVSAKDGLHHLIRTPGEDASDTLKFAAEVLADTLSKDPSKKNMLTDDEIGELMADNCRTSNQMEICSRYGIVDPKWCRDRCCLDSCKFFANKYASCVNVCVNEDI